MTQIESYAEFFAGLDPSDDIVLCGGDGTLNRFANDARGLKIPNTIYLYPVGSRNDFARDLGFAAYADPSFPVNQYLEKLPSVEINSGGDYMGFDMIERHDCLEWVKWVNERCGTDAPIYLAGVSMGASTVLMASELDLPDNVHGIIADCGFTSPDDIWKHVVEHNLHLSYGIRSAVANDICKKKIQMGAKEHSTVEALQKSKVPVLFIHGTDDNFVPVEMIYENYKACAAPKRIFVVPGADHGMSYVVDEKGYQAALQDFWNTVD